jgi:hypothetical protein
MEFTYTKSFYLTIEYATPMGTIHFTANWQKYARIPGANYTI